MVLVLPALPGIKAAFDLTATETQLLLSVYLFSLAASQLVLGVVSDSVGRKPVMLAGVGCFLLASTGLFFAETAFQLLSLRVVQGFGAAASMAMSRTIINDCFARIEAARVTATVTAAMAVIPSLSMAVCGLIVDIVGINGSFALMLILGLFNLVTCLVFVQETNLLTKERLEVGEMLNNYRITLRIGEFRLFAAVAALQAGVFFALQGFLPFKFESIGQSAADFGIWFGLASFGYLTGNILSRRYTQVLGLERIVLIGCFCGMAAMSAMALADLLDVVNPWSYAFCMFAFGIGNGVVVANTLVGAVSAGPRRGTATGLVGAAQVSMGAAAGWLIAVFGGVTMFWVAMLFIHLMLIASLVPATRLYLAARTAGG